MCVVYIERPSVFFFFFFFFLHVVKLISSSMMQRNGETTTPVTLTRSEVSVVPNRSLTLDGMKSLLSI